MTTKEFQERSDLRIFLSYFKPHKKLFVLDMVCALTIALIDLAFPYLSRWCMYELLPQNAYRTFFTVMAVAAAAFAVRGVLTYIIGYYGHTFGILVEADIRRDLFRHMQELDFGYYDRNRTGALMSRLTSELFEITELAHHGPGGYFHLRRDRHRRACHHVYDPVAAGAGDRRHSAGVFDRGVDLPPVDESGVPPCEAENRRH